MLDESLSDKVKRSIGRYTSAMDDEIHRKVISDTTTFFQYANGRILFDAKTTRQIIDETVVSKDIQPTIHRIADEILTLGYPACFTAGLARSRDGEPVFVLVYLQR